MDDGRRWTVACQDVGDRVRGSVVSVEHGHVVISAPPGEVIKLSRQQLVRMRLVLGEAEADLRDQASK